MLAAHAAIVVFRVIPKVLFQRIFRSEVSLTLDAEVVCITAFKVLVPFLVGREIETTFDAKVVAGVSLHMHFVRGEVFTAFAAKVM